MEGSVAPRKRGSFSHAGHSHSHSYSHSFSLSLSNSHGHVQASEYIEAEFVSNSAPESRSPERAWEFKPSSTPNSLKKSHSSKTGARHAARALDSCVSQLNGWNPFQIGAQVGALAEIPGEGSGSLLNSEEVDSTTRVCSSSFASSPEKKSSVSTSSAALGVEGGNQRQCQNFAHGLEDPSVPHTHSTDCVFTHKNASEAQNVEERALSDSDKTAFTRSSSTGAVKEANSAEFDSLCPKDPAFSASKTCTAAHSNNSKCCIPCTSRKSGTSYSRSFSCPAPKVPTQTGHYSKLTTNFLGALPECQPTSAAVPLSHHSHSSMTIRMEFSDGLGNDEPMDKISSIGSTSKGWRNRRKQISQALLRGLWRWKEGVQGRKKKRRHGNEDVSSGGGSGKSSEILGCVYISDPTSEQCPFSASASQSKWSDLPPTSSSGELYYSSGGGGGSSSRKSEPRKKRQEMSGSVCIRDCHMESDFAEDNVRWMSNEIQASNSDYGSELGYGGDEELGYDDFQVDDNEEDVESEGNVKSNLTMNSMMDKNRSKEEMKEMKGKGMKHHSSKYHGNYFSEKNDHGRGKSHVPSVSGLEKSMEMDSEMRSDIEFRLEGARASDTPNARARKLHRMRRRRKHSSESMIDESKENTNKDHMITEKHHHHHHHHHYTPPVSFKIGVETVAKDDST